MTTVQIDDGEPKRKKAKVTSGVPRSETYAAVPLPKLVGRTVEAVAAVVKGKKATVYILADNGTCHGFPVLDD